MRPYRVKLNCWTTPTTIYAESEAHARALARQQHPYCDCGCGEKTKIEWVVRIDPRIKVTS